MKDTAETNAVPQNSRLITDEYFKFLSLAGESFIGVVTLTHPDNRNDSRVKAPVQRFKVTRSYNFAYQYLTCEKKHSMFD